MTRASTHRPFLGYVCLIAGGALILGGILSGPTDVVGGIVFGVVAILAGAAILYGG